MGLQKKKIRIRKKKEQHGSAVPYANESVAITTGEEIKEEYKNQFGNLLERFLTYCVEHNPHQLFDHLPQQLSLYFQYPYEFYKQNQ